MSALAVMLSNCLSPCLSSVRFPSGLPAVRAPFDPRHLTLNVGWKKKDNAWRGVVLRGPSRTPQLGKVTMADIVSVTLQASAQQGNSKRELLSF